MPSKKHFIITSLTLGAIAAASGLLIGAANLITRDQIKKNEAKKFDSGITAIFGENTKASEFNKNVLNLEYIDSSYIIHQGEQHVP